MDQDQTDEPMEIETLVPDDDVDENPTNQYMKELLQVREAFLNFIRLYLDKFSEGGELIPFVDSEECDTIVRDLRWTEEWLNLEADADNDKDHYSRRHKRMRLEVEPLEARFEEYRLLTKELYALGNAINIAVQTAKDNRFSKRSDTSQLIEAAGRAKQWHETQLGAIKSMQKEVKLKITHDEVRLQTNRLISLTTKTVKNSPSLKKKMPADVINDNKSPPTKRYKTQEGLD